VTPWDATICPQLLSRVPRKSVAHVALVVMPALAVIVLHPEVLVVPQVHLQMAATNQLKPWLMHPKPPLSASAR
jgi:hypothetical protein